MSTTPALELVAVRKRYGDVDAVAGVSLTIAAGELFALLGPSGCGKSTLLRLVAGLEAVDGGTVAIGGQEVTALPAHRRPVHTVFQHYALFPHLTVAENVAFGLRYQGVGRDEERARVAEALALVRLSGLERRMPAALSGGQRQRVALARAVVLRPRLLLLDEPLAALDRQLRTTMHEELRSLQRQLGIAFLFVTHDQEEALALADRVAVMHQGRLLQVDRPPVLWQRPRTPFVAAFLGAPNQIRATVRRSEGDAVELAVDAAGDRPLRLPSEALVVAARNGHDRAVGPPREGEAVLLTVRPERLSLRRHDLGERGLPSIPVELLEATYLGERTAWLVSAPGGATLRVLERHDERRGESPFRPGERAFVSWPPRATIRLLADDPADDLSQPGSPDRPGTP